MREKIIQEFWQIFTQQKFDQAQALFDQLDKIAKQIILAELFQKSSYHRKPLMVSVLERKLAKNKSFNDFYNSWHPSEKMCHKIELRGQTFQQHFPTPVRVFNGINMNDSKDIISVGITWVNNYEQEQDILNYIKKTESGKNKDNETRNKKIKQTANGGLIGLYHIQTDDNLGTPF